MKKRQRKKNYKRQVLALLQAMPRNLGRARRLVATQTGPTEMTIDMYFQPVKAAEHINIEFTLTERSKR